MKLQPAFGSPGTLFTASRIIMGEATTAPHSRTRIGLTSSTPTIPATGEGRSAASRSPTVDRVHTAFRRGSPAKASQGEHSISFGAGLLQAASADLTVMPGIPVPPPPGNPPPPVIR
jgi:hypothetical protein